jgi:hypothetical protein
MSKRHAVNHDKISPEFVARLNRLEPEQKVRVMVLLQLDDLDRPPKPGTVRRSSSERRARVQAVRELANRSLECVSGILQRFDGRSLAAQPDALGSIPVEITVNGVTALTTCDAVRAVLEDQPVALRKFGL